MEVATATQGHDPHDHHQDEPDQCQRQQAEPEGAGHGAALRWPVTFAISMRAVSVTEPCMDG